MSEYWSNENTVSRLLEQRAAQTPDSVAFQREAEDGQWRPILWHDFAARVEAIARAMHASGLRKGDRLALIAPVSLEWELLHHAALAMGVVVVGLDAHDLPARIGAMAEQADITAFAVSDASVLSHIVADRLAGCPLLLALGWNTDASQAECGWQRWAAFESSAATTQTRPAAPTADDTATIIFTSGTTGAPKGIAYRHGQVCLAVEAIRDAFSFVGSDGRLLCWLPLSNLFQRMVSLAGLRQGAATYLLADPRRVMQVVARVSPDIFVGVPRFYEKLYDGLRDNIATLPPLKRNLVSWAWQIGRRHTRNKREGRLSPLWLTLVHAAANRLILSKVRSVMGTRLHCMVTGSAPTPRILLEEFHALGWLVLEAYGLTENVAPMAINRPDDFRFGSVGRPLTINEIILADDGTIKVRGSGLLEKYIGEPQGSPLDVENFYHTGDLGRIDDDGFLYLLGRRDDLIKTSTGRRVAPADVEAQLQSVQGVDHALLVGRGRKFLVALCTVNEVPLDVHVRARIESSLRAQVLKINEGQRPVGIALIEHAFSVEQGELTPTLKVRRSAIEERYKEEIDKLCAVILQRPALQGDSLVFISFPTIAAS